ncbi:MAG TPA: ScyD/ScyE family protein [Acidimicrobiia bacterium]
MRKNRAARILTLLALVISVVPIVASPALAASAPAVIATGLNSPYKLTEGPDGAIYVAEAGTGGPSCATVMGPDGPTEACVGSTGSVSRISGSSNTRVVTGLPSVASSGESIGPSAVDFDGSGQMHVLIGQGGNAATRTALGDIRFGTLMRVPTSGSPVIVADLIAYEEANNPDGFEPDSNPFGLAFSGMDALVTDAGGNDLLRVTPAGAISVVAVFPDTMVDAPPFLQIPGQIPMQAVPTSVELNSAGLIHVSQLTGFPFVVGAANIFTVSAGGTVTAAHTGFTNIIDHAIADDGTIYVLEFASNGLLAEEGPQAALVQIRTDGTRKTLLYGSDIPVPGGVAVGSDGMVYLSVCTLCGPGQGMVMRINPSVASDAATAGACPPASVPGTDFGDIGPNLHREAVECAAWWGVVNGYSPTQFAPDDDITRGQVAAMIARAMRAAGVTLPANPADAFTDDNGSIFEADINALAAAGVLLGLPDGTFNPNGLVTRAQVASMLVRAYAVVAGSDLAAGANAFTDDEGSVHEADINAAAAAGWLNGIGGGLFNPNGNAKRGQFSSMVMRMMSTLVDEGLATLPS